MSGDLQGDMASGVVTCTACGRSARSGLRYCPACAFPFPDQAAVGVATPPGAYDAPGQLAFTNSWDSVAPRLQEALFGEFVISRELGRGGMAAVFLAHQLKLDRKVAIKVMAPSLMTGAGLVERFRDEALTVARLEHANIISIFEVGQATGLQYFVMQYVPGRSLERVIRQWGQVPIDVVCGILYEVGTALTYAHRRDVIHRDVKPGNILLSVDGRVIVSDFGIAKVAQSASRTQTGAVIGTPAYMSPEQCLGRPLTWSADQYSLGVIAYEMLTGVQPFSGTSYAVMRGHIEESAPDILVTRPDCPPRIAGAVMRMLAKQPTDRFASMSDALAAMGASRMSMDDAVQDAVGRLAVPLPEEEGVVLVHTPASPAPKPNVAPPAAAAGSGQFTGGWLRFASRRLFASLATVRSRIRQLADSARSVSASNARVVGAAAIRTANALHKQIVAASAQIASAPRRSWIISGVSTALLVTIVVALTMLRRFERPSAAVSEPTLAETATATITATPPIVPDSLFEEARDTLASAGLVDSLDVPVDSSAPYRIAVRNLGTGRISVDDSVDLGAVITDMRGNRIEGTAIRWRASPRDRARIDSVTGRLVAIGSGLIAITARAADLDTTVSMRIVPLTAPRRVGVATDSVGDERAAPAPQLDIETERDAVDRVRMAFLREVLERRDRPRIDLLYRKPTTDDSIGLAMLLDAYADHRTLSVRSEADPPRPEITGDRATSDGRIELIWERRLRQTGKQALLLHIEFQRVASGWRPVGFRLRPVR